MGHSGWQDRVDKINRTVTTFGSYNGMLTAHVLPLEQVEDDGPPSGIGPVFVSTRSIDPAIVAQAKPHENLTDAPGGYRTSPVRVPLLDPEPRSWLRRRGYFGNTLAKRAKPTPWLRLLWATLTLHMLRLWYCARTEWVCRIAHVIHYPPHGCIFSRVLKCRLLPASISIPNLRQHQQQHRRRSGGRVMF